MFQSVKSLLVHRFFRRLGARKHGGALPPVRKAPAPRRRPRLELEDLENRLLLTAWAPVGPAPQTDPNSITRIPTEAASGRVSALAITQDFSSGTEKDLLYLGAAGGVRPGPSSNTPRETAFLSGSAAAGHSNRRRKRRARSGMRRLAPRRYFIK